MHFWLLTAALMATFIIACDASEIRVYESDRNEILSKKIHSVQEIIFFTMQKEFLIKTVQAVASMDPTTSNLIISIQNTPSAALTCIEDNISYISTSTIAKSLSTLPEAVSKACPKYKTEYKTVENAILDIKKRLDNYTPQVIDSLPPGVYRLLVTGCNVSLTMLTDPNATYNITYQQAVINNIVTQINGLNAADRLDFAKLAPWSAPFIIRNGKYASSLLTTLKLINPGLRKPFNTRKLAKSLTTLTLGVASKLPAIAKWVYKKIDALQISDVITKNTTITAAAVNFAEFGNNNLRSVLISRDMANVLKILLGGRFYFSNYIPITPR
uniref:WSN domain-containing protein n=1 Tax=Panagrellus redivivus TaxID=6233 RepID=A0A7E4VSB0_PANRE